MKALAVNGSPRQEGNTALLLSTVINRLSGQGIEVELLSLSGRNLHGCIACMGCKNPDNEHPRCIQEDLDDFKGILDKFLAADIILLGSPVYFGSATPELMAVLHRVGYAVRGGKKAWLKDKLGAAVVCARRAGQNFTFAQLNYFFFINQMIVPGSSYWNIGFGGPAGSVKNDTEGLSTMETLGDNLASLLKKLKRD
ncbi:MAG: hypothetical protein A2293_05665 [Elusimicrobia bacterium RIFOXYB2_FULL_49_7]|nr:MAG: hypothetical protein A2293_05665 [Elusimicrobia bacterium RIFOXYB2_FULL_49_7]